MTELARITTVERIVVDANVQDLLPVVLLKVLPQRDTVLIIDSLLLNNKVIRQILTKTNHSCKSYLLVHYLNLLNPDIQETEIREMELEHLKMYDGYIATSRYTRNILIQNGFPPENCIVIRPGIQIKDMEFTAGKNTSVRLLTVSSILPGKGLFELLKTLESVSDLDWSWELAGETGIDGDYFRKFVKQVERCSVRERITITGALPQREIFRKYRLSDVFVLPSDFESCSMVTMEAMRFGLAVIARKVGGISELVSHSRNGYLVERKEGKEFSERLRELILDESLRKQFGQKGRDLSLQFDDWATAASKLNTFIREKYPTETAYE
jgi:glycosyltransferase involved in cell wall biosynthesis